jgi:hypothetical protein
MCNWVKADWVKIEYRFHLNRGGTMIYLIVALLFLPLCYAQPQGLPVKRVVLYKNGIGYFEHVGPVKGNQEVSIPFTSGQLNDVLKSLTVLDLGGGRITGVAYGSSAPVDRQLGDLRLPIGEASSLTQFLNGLRGARLEIKSGTATITGRLLSIERKTRTGGGTTVEVDYVSLLTESGDLRTTELAPGFSVKLLDAGLAGRVGRYLDIVSAGREADLRSMAISTEGAGDRDLFVSYISEVPVWKSTYRIVLGGKPGASPLLQGWAIVDNTVGQDWRNVQLSLVAGAPQSFVQNLSQPYYTRRPVVDMPESAAISPQTYQATLIAGGARLSGRVLDPAGNAVQGASVRVTDANGNRVAEATSDGAGAYQFAALPEGTLRMDVSAQGFASAAITGITANAGMAVQQDAKLQVGSMPQSLNVQASAAALQTDTAFRAGVAAGRTTGSGRGLGSGGTLGGVGRSSGGGVGGVYSLPAAAAAHDLGDLFEYKLKDPISIAKNRSALVPIVNASITAEKVSIWNDRAAAPRPARALWLTNSTGLTLDGGSFSVMESDTFAGEGVFDAIRPAEKRLVSYALDLAVNASSKNSTEAQRVTRVLIAQGVMTLTSELRERKTYTFRNEDGAPRMVLVEHPVRQGYVLRSETKPAESTADWMRFRVQVDAKQTATLVVEEARPILNTYQLTNLDVRQVELFVRQQSINKAVEDALRGILAQKAAVADLNSRREAIEEESRKIFDDQQRLRENMKVLKGSAEEKQLLQRYTQQLNEEETRLAQLGKATGQLDKDIEAAQGLLNGMIQRLSMDAAV